MKTMNIIHEELKQCGFKNSFAGWSALRQLPRILAEDEVIKSAVTGWYEGGFATIVATNKRIIFIDKKPISIKVEDIHYEMVSDVLHKLGIFTASVSIHSVSNHIELTSLSHRQIRKFAQYVESRANEMRLNVQTWGEMMKSGEENPSMAVRQTVPPAKGTFVTPFDLSATISRHRKN